MEIRGTSFFFVAIRGKIIFFVAFRGTHLSAVCHNRVKSTSTILHRQAPLIASPFIFDDITSVKTYTGTCTRWVVLA
jgi:hypothetical protein